MLSPRKWQPKPTMNLAFFFLFSLSLHIVKQRTNNLNAAEKKNRRTKRSRFCLFSCGAFCCYFCRCCCRCAMKTCISFNLIDLNKWREIETPHISLSCFFFLRKTWKRDGKKAPCEISKRERKVFSSHFFFVLERKRQEKSSCLFAYFFMRFALSNVECD